MPKIKLTKNELKKQRDNLKQFKHYLPTLQLKKQQLQMRILQTRRTLSEKEALLGSVEKKINVWVGLLGELKIDLKQWIIPAEIITDFVNVAGANLPVFKETKFRDLDYDFYATPLWIDVALSELRIFMGVTVEINIIKKQIAILEQELRVTTQRVNLFEKVKIPECIENIRVIRIYLGDQQANAVGISKVAKGKIALLNYEEAAV